MCNQLVCEVCGGQGVHDRAFSLYHATLCNKHFNEMYTKYRKDKKARKVVVELHLAFRATKEIDAGGKKFNAWIDAEHKLFLMVDGFIKDMKKEWDKKNKKQTPRSETSDKGEPKDYHYTEG